MDLRAVHILAPNVDSVSHICLIFIDINEKLLALKTDRLFLIIFD